MAIGSSTHLSLAEKFVDEAADIGLIVINNILLGWTVTVETPLIGNGFPEKVTFPTTETEEVPVVGIKAPCILWATQVTVD